MSRRSLSAAALVGALALTGCAEETASEPETSLSGVEVTGDAGAEPTVSVDAPLELSRTESAVVIEGDGKELGDSDLVTVQAVIANGTSGETLTSTWENDPVGLDLSAQDLFPAFKTQLPGKKVGSRVTIAATPADAYGDAGNEQLGIGAGEPVVFVVDLVDSPEVLESAQGTEVEPKKDLPSVEWKADAPAAITIPDGVDAPKNTVVQPLITGDGPKVEKGQTIKVTYTGVLYKNGEVFDSSFNNPAQPSVDFPIGVGQVIKGWDEGLVGQTVGSRILLLVPPKDGYGDAGRGDQITGKDTLVFVVDILSAY